jgi:hypothetical protein
MNDVFEWVLTGVLIGICAFGFFCALPQFIKIVTDELDKMK